jgi:hypothetical protein
MAKTIMSEMANIQIMTEQLKRNLEGMVITPNKIWLPNRGLVILWETKHAKNN